MLHGCILVMLSLTVAMAIIRRSTVVPYQHRQVLSTTIPVWNNDYNLVHVIQTRFMQQQPNLLHLGKARLQLFQTICLPSMLSQTSQQYLWIIRTDPQLHNELKTELLDTVRNVRNIVIVASNENPEGFREAGSIADITPGSVWSGSYQMVQDYHQAAQDRIVLETRLDADDGIAYGFVQSVQQQAASTLTHAWKVWCVDSHVEWQYNDPWDAHTTRGSLFPIRTIHCITPGLTWGYHVQASRRDIVVSEHHRIHKFVPSCEIQSARCLTRLQIGDSLPLAIRARTPTSAGMANLILNHKRKFDHLPIQASQELLWNKVPDIFGLEATKIWEMRAYLQSHLTEIVKDALHGQCTKGHSCKVGSREALEALLAATS